MPEILVISGKGGTGKTSLTAAFAHLSKNAILCDLDVDAPDLHLLLQPKKLSMSPFYAGHEAVIIPEVCTRCGICIDHCRFNAISERTSCITVNSFKCEGCKVCVTFCPQGAIAFPEKHCGESYVSETRFGPLVHAQLFPAEENSGRLVALLKKEAKALAKQQNASFILSDGPPGIGCPVISALSGTDLAVIVTEPTPSGLHDLKRVGSLCEHFRVRAGVIINKADLSPEYENAIRAYADDAGYRVIAALPHDPVVTHAMVAGKAITEFTEGPMTEILKTAWAEIEEMASSAPALRMSRL